MEGLKAEAEMHEKVCKTLTDAAETVEATKAEWVQMAADRGVESMRVELQLTELRGRLELHPDQKDLERQLQTAEKKTLDSKAAFDRVFAVCPFKLVR